MTTRSSGLPAPMAPHAFRAVLAVIAVAVLFAADRAVMAGAEAMLGTVLICPAYPRLAVACAEAAGGPGIALPATGAVAVATAMMAAWAWARLRHGPAFVALMLLLGNLALAVSVDVLTRGRALTPDTASLAFAAVSLSLVAGTVIGLAVAGRPTRGSLAIAACCYGLGIGFRVAAFQITLGIWPFLYDATRMAALFLIVLLGCSMAAVLCFVGPVALADPASARGHRTPRP